MHDLDDLLTGGDGFGHCLANSPGLDRFDKVARHIQRDVCFQQSGAHFAQGGVDISLGQRAGLGQTVEDATKAF